MRTCTIKDASVYCLVPVNIVFNAHHYCTQLTTRLGSIQTKQTRYSKTRQSQELFGEYGDDACNIAHLPEATCIKATLK